MNSQQIHITTPEHISIRFQLAGLGSRAAAFLIDNLILAVFHILIYLAFLAAVTDFLFFFDRINGYLLAALIIIQFVLIWGYYILFEYFAAGRTPGKKLLGLRVLHDNGQSITFLSAFMRNILRLIDMLPGFYFVGLLMIFLHPKHKRIGDLAAGTIVVYEGKRSKQKNALEKEIDQWGIDPERISLSDWSRKKIGTQEWNLLKTYVERRASLSKNDRVEMTQKVAGILLPLIEEETQKPPEVLEADLLALYLKLREDWEFDLK